MGNLLNLGAMKIRLTFLLRLTLRANDRMINEGRSQRLIETQLSEIISDGIHLIYKHRYDNAFSETENEIRNGIGIGNVILDEFIKISDEIVAECKGKPLSLTIVKRELIILAGIDRLMKTLKELFKGKEEINA